MARRAYIGGEIRKRCNAFYEAICLRLRVRELLLSAFVGIAFVALQVSACRWRGADAFRDHSWMIGVMIGLCIWLVFQATHRLKEFVANLVVLTGQDVTEFRRTFLTTLNRILGVPHLVSYGITFGVLNAILGAVFGYWYTDLILKIVLTFGYFVVGFTCGIAVGGITGVVRLVRDVGRFQKLTFDLFAHDNCGGTLIVGKLLFHFAIYTLVMGCFIALYIHISPWPHRNDNILVHGAVLAWMVVPFVCSLLVFLFPVVKIHALLLAYRNHELARLRHAARSLSEMLERLDLRDPQAGGPAANISAQLRRLETTENLLRRMNTWPYDLKYRATYLFSLATPVFATLLADYLKKVLGT